MALGNVVAQTTREALSPPMREPGVAPTLLPGCRVSGLIRDESRSSLHRERAGTPPTCPTYFTKVLGRVRQHSESAVAFRQYLKRHTVHRREP